MSREDAEKNITLESISFGKKSNMSNSTENKKKQSQNGAMKIKIG
jgi:hypothetical protein